MVILKNKKSNQGAQSAFINKKSSELIQTKDNSKYLCIATLISYILTFSYIYGSATYRGKLKWVKITEKTSYTMSEAVQHSEKIGSTILIILTLALLQGYFASLNFYNVKEKNLLSKCISVEVVTYLTLTAWILLFFVNREKTYGHGIVAFVFSTSVLFYSVMLKSIYNDVYIDEPGTNVLGNIDIISYFVMVAYAIVLFFFILNIVIKDKKFTIVKDYFIGTFEIVCIVSFLVFFGMLAELPPLPEDFDLVCYSI
jgi:hypothetical protein